MNTFYKALAGLVVGILGVGFSAGAYAGLLTPDRQCSAGTAYYVDETDVTGNNGGSDDCWGAESGNNGSPLLIDTDGDGTGDVEYIQLAKLDVGEGGDPDVLSGLDIGLDITGQGTSSGTWQYDPTKISFDVFLIVIKAANDPGYAAWLFEDDSADSFSGNWEITWLHKENNIPAISHISIYSTEGGFEVPEPGMLMLLGLSLAGLTFLRRKR